MKLMVRMRQLGLVGLLCLMLFAMLGGIVALPAQEAAAAGGTFGGGDGSAGNPYRITDVLDLQAMSSNPSAYYALANDIDASATSEWNGGAGFVPVGSASDPFTGTFDGRGYTITGLFIDRSSSEYVGLFGLIFGRSSVSNVSLANVIITGGNYVGGLVGDNYGTVSYCYATGTVSGARWVGGLVGASDGGTVSYCYATGTVIGAISYVGGLMGDNRVGTVSNSYATGTVSGSQYVGGLMGCNYVTVSDCYSTGSVSGSQYVGGLVGYNGGTVSDSFYDKDTSGQSDTGKGVPQTTAQMMAQSTFAGWDFTGTWWMVDGQTRPFLRMEWGTAIRNSHQLQLMAMDMTAAYTLAGDIDLSDIIKPSQMWGTNLLAGAGFVPVGNASDPFTGTFDGRGYTITGLFIDRSSSEYVGLFGLISGRSSVSNVGLANVIITGGYSVGGLVGGNLGNVSDSYSTGNVCGTNYVGGLVGGNAGNVSDSSSTGNVSGTNCVGGLVGVGDGGTVSYCYATGTVIGNGISKYVGGLVGGNAGNVSDSYSTGNVSGNGISEYVGGLVGYNHGGNVSDSYSTGNVSGGDYVGGLVGYNRDGMVYYCYATGNVSGTGISDYVGGLAGYNNGSVSKSYSTGNIGGASPASGGLLGGNGSLSTVTGCFWDTQTSGYATSYGGAGATGKTTAEMKDYATFFNAYWDLKCETRNGRDDIWGINESGTENNGYPFLWWQDFTNKVTLKLTMASDGHGTTSPDAGDHIYNCSEVVNIAAINDSCYRFVNWTGTGVTAKEVADPNSASTTINMSNDYTVQANFAIRIMPTITWANPADIVYGTALSAVQLNATALVPGSFVYIPAAETVLSAGNNQNLRVDFTPTDAVNYCTASKTVTINVSKKAITVTADNKGKIAGAALPDLTATATGLVGTDNLTSLSLGYVLNTTAIVTSPVGTYNITITDGATTTANYGPIAYVNGTLTVTAGGFIGGGGGGGGGAPAANLMLQINMWDKSGLSDNWIISKDGFLQQDVNAASLEGVMNINISKGAKLLDASGKPLMNISVTPIDPPADAPKGYHVLRAFDFNPDNATFDPGMKITMAFNASGVAPGETVVIAFYNETTGKWEFIKGAIVEDGTAKFTLTHFSIYAVMSGSEELKVPEPTVTPTPTPVTDAGGGIGTGVIVGIAAGILVLFAGVVWLVRGRIRPKKA